MLRTCRAYLCQTVTEATPMSRIASAVVGQARQALEGLFRRAPKVPSGTITRTEAPVLAVGRRGLVAGIDRGSRTLIRQFLSRNRQADLAAAMRSRYSVTGRFQGVGQKLATFGFVGVGVAAGSQWGRGDVDEDFHFEPFFDTVQTMYGEGKMKVARSRAMLTDFQTTLEEFSRTGGASCIETELSFVLLDNSCISSGTETASQAVIDDLSMQSNAMLELTNQKSDCDETAEMTLQFSSPIEEMQTQLGVELLAALKTVDAQRSELRELHTVVTQLGVALAELTNTTTSMDDFVVIEDEDIGEDWMKDEERLSRALTLVLRQRQQLDALRGVVHDQTDQLKSLNSGTSTSGSTVIRSDYCKRDACCGPGSDG